jgi:hypothetical protein
MFFQTKTVTLFTLISHQCDKRPSYFFAQLAYFVINGYANMWLYIKTRSKARETARLTWESMDFLIQLPEEEKAFVLPVFE